MAPIRVLQVNIKITKEKKETIFGSACLLYHDPEQTVHKEKEPLTRNQRIKRITNTAITKVMVARRTYEKMWGFKVRHIGYWIYIIVVKPTNTYASVVWWTKVQQKRAILKLSKVYCIVQETGESASNLREKLLEMDREINEINMKLKGVSEQYKTKSKLISDAKGKISLSSALHQKANIEQQTEEIKNKLNQYSGKELVCPQKKSQVLKEYEKYLKETKKRRRIGMDMLNAILENYPKTKKHLFEDIGIETDDDVGFSLERLAKIQRLRWLGHIARMEEGRVSNELINTEAGTKRKRGRPRRKWLESAKEDLKSLRVQDWKNLAQDRKK
ncbi:unnamed protein product [Diabrotica balteata]|uniref:Leucine zipper with capping helix domain-containing protein n=1 Tax=Diabrotica balteata TaxID=107213 RepID=A0A9N9XEK7_DIABA|nr:unnamed protein product [Diabrotica balteata]